MTGHHSGDTRNGKNNTALYCAGWLGVGFVSVRPYFFLRVLFNPLFCPIIQAGGKGVVLSVLLSINCRKPFDTANLQILPPASFTLRHYSILLLRKNHFLFLHNLRASFAGECLYRTPAWSSKQQSICYLKSVIG